MNLFPGDLIELDVEHHLFDRGNCYQVTRSTLIFIIAAQTQHTYHVMTSQKQIGMMHFRKLYSKIKCVDTSLVDTRKARI